jgi:NAD(P)-dependent dehydrogenase (short-subunit alcohol dehydrogenase family)
MDIQSLFGLEGKTALVTGGATGIGRMACEALVRAGATVLMASRKGDACEAVAAELNALAMLVVKKASMRWSRLLKNGPKSWTF